jgi:aspartate carbamoyltransferase catalytic subunit
MRHFQKGAPHEAAKWASIPVVNGGDGWGEHPTQVLTDLYTLHKVRGRIDGLKFMCVGDARMRTMHSIGHALTQFDCEVTYVHPADMALDEEYKNDFRSKGLRFKEADHIDAAIGTADVIYIEPVVQADYTKSRVDTADVQKGLTPENFKITQDVLARKAKSDVIVLHSLPRMDELSPDVDETRHARYWQEAYYGVVMKMGMFALMLGAAE